jgi:hypothetical protein
VPPPHTQGFSIKNRSENRSLRAQIKAENGLKASSRIASDDVSQQQPFPMLEELSRLAREQQETQKKLAAAEALVIVLQEKLPTVATHARTRDRESVENASSSVGRISILEQQLQHARDEVLSCLAHLDAMERRLQLQEAEHSIEQAELRQQVSRLQQMVDDRETSRGLTPEVTSAFVLRHSPHSKNNVCFMQPHSDVRLEIEYLRASECPTSLV